MENTQFTTAVHIMTALAFHQKQEAQKLNSELLAKSLHSNPVVVRRLLSKLTKAGLVETSRGKSGGVALAQKYQAITLDQIYSAVSTSKMICTPKKPQLKECPVSCSMGELLSDVADGVEAASLDYLKKIKLSDLVKRVSS